VNINRRTGVLQTPTGTALLDIVVSGYKKIMVTDTTYLTSKTVVSTPNKELTTPSTLVLADPNMAGRYVLLSTNAITHTGLDFKVYYDTKYKDIIVIPNLEQYAGISDYLNNNKLVIIGHGINFNGKEGSPIPVPNTGYDIRAAILTVGDRLSNSAKGRSFRKEIVVGYTTTDPSVGAKTVINFGTPAQMFATLGFMVDINLFGFNSLTEARPQSMGKQVLANTGTLIAELSL